MPIYSPYIELAEILLEKANRNKIVNDTPLATLPIKGLNITELVCKISLGFSSKLNINENWNIYTGFNIVEKGGFFELELYINS